MKKEFDASFIYEDVLYDYRAVIYSGDDAYMYNDEIALSRADGAPITDYNTIETAAFLNAELVIWCDTNGWLEQDTGCNCTALIKDDHIITRADAPSIPRTVFEPIIADNKYYLGGIHEYIQRTS